jgi:hypothetical protein
MATYYWVGGNGTWDNSSTTNWATSSGGAGGLGPPTNADTVNFDANSGTAATVTVASTAVSLSTIVNKSDINLSLSGSPTLCTSAGTLTLTTGTLTLNTFTLTAGIFSSNNSNARTVAFGTGNITLTGNATTIWSLATATNFARSGTPVVNCTYSGATGTRTINHGGSAGGSETNCVSYNISAGTDTITFTNSATNAHLNVIFTGFAGALSNTTWYCYGNLTFSTGMTITAGASSISLNATSGIQQLTTNGKTIDCPVNRGGLGGTLQLQDALTMGSTRTFGLGGGTLDLFNKTLTAGLFSSNATAVRSIAFGTGNITIIGSGATIWQTSNATNFTYTGTPTVNVTYSGSTGTRTLAAHSTAGTQATVFNFNFSAGSDTITLTTTFLAKNINFTGFTGTLSNTAINSYGDVTIASGMTLTAGASVMSFVGASVTQLITTNAKTLDFPLTFNGVGGTFAFQDALTQGATRAFTITNGTVQLKASATSTVGVFTTSGSTQKNLQSTTSGTKATLSQASGTVSASYLTVRDIAATGGAVWNAYTSNNNIDAGNNSGWDFSSQIGRYIYTRRKNKRILP